MLRFLQQFFRFHHEFLLLLECVLETLLKYSWPDPFILFFCCNFSKNFCYDSTRISVGVPPGIPANLLPVMLPEISIRNPSVISLKCFPCILLEGFLQIFSRSSRSSHWFSEEIFPRISPIAFPLITPWNYFGIKIWRSHTPNFQGHKSQEPNVGLRWKVHRLITSG